MIRSATTRLETITENLANSTTPGYKRLMTDGKAFDTVFQTASHKGPLTWAGGLQYDPVAVDFTPGTFHVTGRHLDAAIEGDGFFVLQKDGRDYYTRNGRFTFDSDGRLGNGAGCTVKAQGGEISVPAGTNLGSISVDNEGVVRAGERTLGRLDVVTFPDTTRLGRAGTTLFSAPPDMSPELVDARGKVVPGALEGSNTCVMQEMAELIQCVRAYEACQRMLRTHDQTEERLVQQTA